MNLGTVAELFTSKKEIVPISFIALKVKDVELFTKYFGIDSSSKAYQYAFAEISGNDIRLNDFFKPLSGEKANTNYIIANHIVEHSQESIVFQVSFYNEPYFLKCTHLIVSDSISRYGSSSYKTNIQHEVEGYFAAERNYTVKKDFAKMYAYGNMWMGDDGFRLGPVMEVILMQYLPLGSLKNDFRAFLTSKDYDNALKIWASAFSKLYKLHKNNIVHGNCELNNLFKVGNSDNLVWTNPDRLIERNRLNIITWNTLKLMDIFVLLFGGEHARLLFFPKISDKNFMQFRSLMGDDKCFILPNMVYSNRLYVFDDDSCAVLNSLFSSGIDSNFLQQEDILQNRTLLSFTNPLELKKFIIKCYEKLDLVKGPAERFSIKSYMRVLNAFGQQNNQPKQPVKVVSYNPDIIAGKQKLAEKGKYFKLETPFHQQMLSPTKTPLWYKIRRNNSVKVVYMQNKQVIVLPVDKMLDYYYLSGSYTVQEKFKIYGTDGIIEFYIGKQTSKLDMKYTPPKQI